MLEVIGRYVALLVFLCASATAGEARLQSISLQAICSPFQLHAAAVDTDTFLPLGSISKLVTSVTAIKTLHSHQVELDSSIDLTTLELAESPNFVRAQTTLTWRQLLRHERGLYNYSESPSFQSRPDMAPDIALAMALNSPGYSEWHYSNSNYLLAGLLLQKISQQPWPELVQQQLFTPLGIEQSAWRYPESNQVPSSDMGLSLRAQDALRFICAVFDGQLLDREQRRELLNFVWLNDNYAYGLGLSRKQVKGHTVYFHTGATDAIHAGLYYLPKQKRALLLWQPRTSGSDKNFERWETTSLKAMLP